MTKIFTKLFSVLLFWAVFSNASQAQWQILGPKTADATPVPTGVTTGAASNISLAVSPQGVLYMAFVNVANESKVSVMRYTATTGWETVGAAGISAGAAGATSLAIAPDGTPYVYYVDLREANLNKGMVMSYNGTAWVAVGNQATLQEATGTIAWPVIAINAAGVPHIGYRDIRTTSPSSASMVRRFDSTTGDWISLGESAQSQAGISRHSIFFDSEGKLYWGGQDWARSSVKVYSGEGTTWTKMGTGNTTGGARAALATAYQNTPYLLYQESGSGAVNNNLSVFKYSGTGATGWDLVGPAQFSGGGVDWANIVVDNTGTPVVAYEESATTKAVVKKFNSTTNTWDYIATPWGDALSQGLANFTAMVKGPQGNIFVAFSDAGVEGKAVVLQIGSLANSSKDRERVAGVKVFPNPSSSSFRFTATGKFNFTVYNQSGQVMEQGQGVAEGNVGAKLSAGLYLIKVQTEAGSQTLKLLKQ